MKILAIETSCDETAAAVVESGTKILSNIVASSADLHIKTGGIIPEQAARQQIKSIIPVINSALLEAKIKPNHLDALAVTVGPGLIGSLIVGVETAKTLSSIWQKPIIPVNHLLAHLYANWLEHPNPPEFPAIALVVSGGHTDLVLLNNHPYSKSKKPLKWIGGTRDDAAGEAFDKTARLLGLPYPGGPAISVEAEIYQKENPTNNLDLLPRPMIGNDDFDMSFSGLKTAVLRQSQNKQIKNKVKRLSAETQEAIVDVLVDKTLKAVNKYQPKTLLLAGGVAANTRLRNKFRLAVEKLPYKLKFFVPSPKLCTDNAAYIASFAYFNNSPTPWQKIQSNPQLTIVGDK